MAMDNVLNLILSSPELSAIVRRRSDAPMFGANFFHGEHIDIGVPEKHYKGTDTFKHIINVFNGNGTTLIGNKHFSEFSKPTTIVALIKSIALPAARKLGINFGAKYDIIHKEYYTMLGDAYSENKPYYLFDANKDFLTIKILIEEMECLIASVITSDLEDFTDIDDETMRYCRPSGLRAIRNIQYYKNELAITTDAKVF